MKTKIILLAVLSCILSGSQLFAQNVETRVLSPFTQIHGSGNADIKYVVGSDFRIEIKALAGGDSKIVTSRVDNKMLYLALDDLGKKTNSFDITVYAPVITSVSMQGTGDFEAQRINGKTFSIALSGSCDVDIDELKVDNDINIALSSSSDAKIKSLSGTIINIAAKGSSDFKSNTLKSNQLNIALDGSSDVDIKDVQVVNLNVATKSSSDVKIGGKADNVNIASGGMSDIDISKLTYKNIKKN